MTLAGMSAFSTGESFVAYTDGAEAHVRGTVRSSQLGSSYIYEDSVRRTTIGYIPQSLSQLQVCTGYVRQRFRFREIVC